MMDYEQAVREIEERGRFADRPGVENSAIMFARLGIVPSGEVIHIAGTNGKGSTASYTAALLAQRGHRVGLFTSPHLVSYTERIAVVSEDGIDEISREAFAGIIGKLLNSEQISDISPVLFDFLLVAAIEYFNSEGCDVLVLETGLGGRLDSTTAVPKIPAVYCITSIDFDHTSILGDTIEEIAAEKAGIIRRGAEASGEKRQICIVGEMSPEAKKIIRERCAGCGVQYEEVPGKDSSGTPHAQSAKTAGEGSLADESLLFPKVPAGTYQIKNIANAAAICSAFGEKYSFDEAYRICKDISVPGRLAILSREPFVIADVAHNRQGVRELARSLRALFGDEKYVCAVSMLNDRKPEEVFAPILDLAEKVYVFTVGGERGESAEVIASYFRENGLRTGICRDIGQLKTIAEESGRRLVVFGSFYFVGEVEKLYAAKI